MRTIIYIYIDSIINCKIKKFFLFYYISYILVKFIINFFYIDHKYLKINENEKKIV